MNMAILEIGLGGTRGHLMEAQLCIWPAWEAGNGFTCANRTTCTIKHLPTQAYDGGLAHSQCRALFV